MPWDSVEIPTQTPTRIPIKIPIQVPIQHTHTLLLGFFAGIIRFLCWDNYLTAWNKIRFLQGSKDSCPERAQGGHGECRGASRGLRIRKRDNNSHTARAESKGTSTLQNSRNSTYTAAQRPNVHSFCPLFAPSSFPAQAREIITPLLQK